jgi:hypothetical protein
MTRIQQAVGFHPIFHQCHLFNRKLFSNHYRSSSGPLSS